ncbi:MAG: LPS assembly lipoprotein LptE [Alphaproteobacteria bacterium]
MIASALALALLALAACGFEPVYGRGSTVRHAELAAIDVAPIDSLAGLALRNQLIPTLGSNRGESRYQLNIALEEQQGEFAIQSNAEVTRYKLALSASFTLTDLATGETVYSGATRSVGSYNVVQSEFATVASENDARKRAAQDLADNIRELLIVHFSRETPTAQTTP